MAEAFHFDGRPRLFLDDGAPVHQLAYMGSFAECCVVSQDCAVPVLKQLPFDRACLIDCGVMTGFGAATNIAKVEPGSSVAVIGCGAVGLSAIQGAKHAGAVRIVAGDRAPDKLDMARAVGATHALFAAMQDVTDKRGADVVIESAGNRNSLKTSIELVRPGGQVVWLGKLPADDEASFRAEAR